MIDRDPLTEPAGDLVAAQTLLDVLGWVDEGGQEQFERLAELLLHWKGRRLRDTIAETGVGHLGRRLELLAPDSSPEHLSRLAMAAGLVLGGAALAEFVKNWWDLAGDDEPFRVRRMEALDGLISLVTRRTDRDLGEAGVRLLEVREILPPRQGDPGSRRIDGDARLAEYLYRNFGRGGDDLVPFVRKWLTTCADASFDSRHKVLRAAVRNGHWDVVQAWFAAGDLGSRRNLLHVVVDGDDEGPLGTLVARRMLRANRAVLADGIETSLQHLVAGTGRRESLVAWCRCAVEGAGPELPADLAAVKAALSTVAAAGPSDGETADLTALGVVSGG